MELSSRVKNSVDSITLKTNQKVIKLAESGKHVYNLTAGQLPFKPMPELLKRLIPKRTF
jgi:aspartate aminotransferase